MPDADENRSLTPRAREPRRGRHSAEAWPQSGDRFISVKIGAVSNLHRQG
jgi:hypothetical protein